MIWIALSLGAVGVALSALFSGSETGFYRATRIRLVLDALGGDLVSRLLAWLTNHPSLFIATTLVGNNLANYLASLAILMATHAIFSSESHVAELCAPLLLAPVLFVYGELVPKSLFLSAPNRLLRMSGPLLLVAFPLFFPLSVVLWGLNRLLASLVAESPDPVRLTVARRELHRTLEEGHESGILHPVQRELARGIFAVVKQPAADYVTPLAKVAKARTDMTGGQVRLLAQRFSQAALPVEDAGQPGRLVGYVRVIDLALDQDLSGRLGPVRPLLEIPATATLIDAVMRMHAGKETVAQVVTGDGRPLGILTAERLREPLLSAKG